VSRTSKSKNSESKPPKKIILKSRKAVAQAMPDSAGTERSSAAESSSVEVSGDERHQLVSKAAYYRAERRRFTPGHELEDWFDAEVEIDKMLSLNSPSRAH
jgi:hypothetical protein